jgi:hypothetical protein
MPGRWAIVIAGVGIAVAAHARPSGRAPELNDVLKRAAAYVERFHQQLSQIVSEETYAQTVADTSRRTDAMRLWPSRTLRSDLILVRSAAEDRFVELRDVFEVDGQPVRDRQARLERLLGASSRAAGSRIAAIIQESARYNVGTIRRNVNTPLLALMFLQDHYQDRFRFTHVTRDAPVFKESGDRELNEAPVFRVSTEMWTIEYQERRKATVIRTPSGGNLPARGRFWIDPSSGAVVISEMIVDAAGVVATVTVSYQSEPLLGFLVPIEMRESYLRDGERITGHAVYGKFRLLKQ